MATLSAWKLLELVNDREQSKWPWSRSRTPAALPHGFPGLIGNTPLLELKSLSKATGCRILVRVAISSSSYAFVSCSYS